MSFERVEADVLCNTEFSSSTSAQLSQLACTPLSTQSLCFAFKLLVSVASAALPLSHIYMTYRAMRALIPLLPMSFGA